MTKHFTDKDSIESIQNQDDRIDDVLKHLYEVNFTVVKKMIQSYGGSEDNAADIFQDGIISTYNSILEGKFKGKSTINTYIYAVTRNMWLKSIRKSDKVSFVDVSNFGDMLEQDDDLDIDQIDKTSLLHKSICQLGKDCRTLLLDFYFNKLSMSKIMEKFGLGSEQAAKNKKYRCMKQLMTLCKENGLMEKSQLSE